MNYREALTAAGAEVLHMENFGNYQGEWWAYVRYGGECGWVVGAYGSCSQCDAFEGEFGYFDDKPEYEERLRDFGLGYLDKLYTHEEAIKIASADLEWDGGAQDVLDFINKVRGDLGG